MDRFTRLAFWKSDHDIDLDKVNVWMNGYASLDERKLYRETHNIATDVILPETCITLTFDHSKDKHDLFMKIKKLVDGFRREDDSPTLESDLIDIAHDPNNPTFVKIRWEGGYECKTERSCTWRGFETSQ